MRSHFRTQTGSVTAELAVVLPSVLLVATTLVGGLVLSAQKVTVTLAAGTLSRAVARGEPLDPLARQLGVTATIEYLPDFVCVKAVGLTQPVEIIGNACARKLGL